MKKMEYLFRVVWTTYHYFFPVQSKTIIVEANNDDLSDRFIIIYNGNNLSIEANENVEFKTDITYECDSLFALYGYIFNDYGLVPKDYVFGNKSLFETRYDKYIVNII